MEISKHTFFITGGNSGLGAATVRHLLQLNANVVITDLNWKYRIRKIKNSASGSTTISFLADRT